MKVADFDFLRRKEFMIFCFFLLVLAFSQIALDLTYERTYFDPLLKLNNSFLESLGLFLPFFTAIFLFFQSRSKKDYTWLPPGKYIIGFLILFLFVFLFPLPEPSEDSPGVNPINNTTTTTPTSITSPSTTPPSETGPSPYPGDQISDYGFLIGFLNEFRNIFILAVLFFPLLFIFIVQRRSKPEKIEQKQQFKEMIDDSRESDYEIRSILGCYYLASTVLEERGANDSPTLTPSEFNIDVLEKKISTHDLIGVLTDLFEEAKFSIHKIPKEKVEHAKSITSEIILVSEPTSDIDKMLADSLVNAETSKLEEENTD